jgi:hypothetical protein
VASQPPAPDPSTSTGYDAPADDSHDARAIAAIAVSPISPTSWITASSTPWRW